MEENKDVYEALAAHLDRLPAGFPRTPENVEIRILKRLFTPEEAALAQLVSLKPQPPEDIAARSGHDPAELAAKLEAMSRRGLIFRVRKGDMVLYMAAQFVIGIWEYHVNDLDPELIRDINEYLPHFFKGMASLGTPQLRTIPISKALPSEQAIVAYDEARKIVLEQEKVLVAPCICRKEHQIMGHGCDRPMESCLVFGVGADYYLENGLGRMIEKEEALGILDRAEASGLVLQPSNAQKVVNICTCCGCCCQILKNLKKLPAPARHVASNYFAVVDSEACSGCSICAGRCQMDAVDLEGGTASILKDRCIGCGLCVSTCPEEAISLEMKPEEERTTPPANFMETHKRIAKERIARLRAVSKE
ncbi:MAG: 4Fe-4S dicluster-binding protein [Acidobacteriota bacterium]